MPLLYIHLDFYLPFVPQCTQLCPYSALILTPDLCLAPICAALPSNISKLCHLRPILLSSLFRYPPLPALQSTIASSCAPFAMPFLPSDLTYLLPYLRLARRHVLIPVLPFAQPLLTHPPCADFLPALVTFYLVLHPGFQLILPSLRLSFALELYLYLPFLPLHP